MKKSILIATIALTSFASCGSEVKTEDKEDSKKTENSVASLDDMCDCAADIMELGNKMQADMENEDLQKEFEARAKECEEIGKSLEAGKTEEEIETMKNEFMESCDAVQEMMNNY